MTNPFLDVIDQYKYGSKAISERYRKTMTDINLDNVEVKSAGFTAVVNDKEIQASIQDAQKAEEARAKAAEDKTAVPFDVA